MLVTAFASLAICCYCVGSYVLIRHIAKTPAPKSALIAAWLAAILQSLYVLTDINENHSFNFGFFSTAALVAGIVALILLIAAISKPVAKLGIAIFPTAAAMLVLDRYFADSNQQLSSHGWAMTSHILASIIAFSLLNIAALQALLLAFQDQQLKSHPPKRFAQSLPSLQTMESLLFQMLSAGVLFLSVSLVTGFVFIEDLFAQHLVHKTVLSISAWLLFSGLLLGRWRYGWRGQIALYWTLSGFLLLMLAYFGSKFVLELILHR
jgi:ABC-type uncharacterized transport system permease subunit